MADRLEEALNRAQAALQEDASSDPVGAAIRALESVSTALSKAEMYLKRAVNSGVTVAVSPADLSKIRSQILDMNSSLTLINQEIERDSNSLSSHDSALNAVSNGNGIGSGVPSPMMWRNS